MFMRRKKNSSCFLPDSCNWYASISGNFGSCTKFRFRFHSTPRHDSDDGRHDDDYGRHDDDNDHHGGNDDLIEVADKLDYNRHNREYDEEQQKQHFQSWETFWGRPGYGAPREVLISLSFVFWLFISDSVET